jgi:hypothetical protein
MSSYKKLKNGISYYQQRGEDLEEIIIEMYKHMKQQGIKPVIPLTPKGITGDRFINDISTGECQRYLTDKAEDLLGAQWTKEQVKGLEAKAKKYKPESSFKIYNNNKFDFICNMRNCKEGEKVLLGGVPYYGVDRVSDVAINLSNSDLLEKEQLKEIAEVICEALNKFYNLPT